MISLNDRKWKAFSIKDIFVTINDEKQVPTGAYIEKKYLHQGDTPRITVTSNNNGIDNFWWTEHKNNRSFSNFISVNFLGDAFYHPYNASLDMKVHCLKLKNRELNKNLALFLCAMLMNNTKNSNYGNQLSSTDIVSKHILLPVDISGAPDYYFMETFAKERLANKQSEYIDYAKAQLAQIERERVDNEAIKWRMFRIGDLFEIRRPAPRNKDDYAIGDINFVASGATNNGVMKSCQPKNGEKLDTGNCISVSPVDGSCFYQPIDFLGRGGAGSSIILLYPKNKTRLNKYIGLSLSRLIYQTAQKYTYGHMANKDGVARDKIMLPTRNGSDIDYAWLENCTKVIMYKKYLSYLNYVIS